MSDCRCEQICSKFDEPYARGKLERYRSSGPDATTRMLLHAIAAEGVEGRTLLDIGGGVGAIQHELIRRGVSSVQEVEASPAYAAACRAEARAQGHRERITHLVGDFGSLVEQVLPADIVTLDRSVCCWHDPLALVDQSAAKSRWLYGLVYPRDAWWVRYGWRYWGNLKQLLKRSGLRLQTPRSADVERILAGHGLHLRSSRRSGVWQIALFGRESGPA